MIPDWMKHNIIAETHIQSVLLKFRKCPPLVMWQISTWHSVLDQTHFFYYETDKVVYIYQHVIQNFVFLQVGSKEV
jgi:hypothetical protein